MRKPGHCERAAAGGFLTGGTGNDTITGGAGRSILIGDTGNDILKGGPNGDILIAGEYELNFDTNAMLAILAEWQRTDKDYATRVADLRTGGGLANGHSLIFNQTVSSEVALNTLTSDASTPVAGKLDWFFANFASPGTDFITDLASGELVN